MVKNARPTEKEIIDKQLIAILKGINLAKRKQAVIGGEIREQVKYAQENSNYHAKAGAHVAKIIRMAEKDPLALAEFDRYVTLYRDKAIQAGLLQEHVGDLLEGSDPNEVEADEAEQFDASTRYDEIIAAEKKMAERHGEENAAKVAAGIKQKKPSQAEKESDVIDGPWAGFKN